MQLKDKVALVTGSSSGIGEAAARHLAREGARVALLARTEESLRNVAADIQRSGGEAMVLAADISEPDQMRQVISRIDSQWGRLDIVFANAGINGVWAPLEELEPEDFDNTININLRGTFLTLRYAVPLIRKGRRGGAVVITSSVNGTRVFSNSGATAYASTKAAQVALAKMLALELAGDRIRVNVICPGAIETDIDERTEQRDLDKAREPVEFPEGRIPLTDGRPGTSAQVADLVLFLVSDASSHITGTELWIDGGESLLQG